MFKNDITCFENTFSFSEAADLNMYYCGKRIKTPNHSYGPEIRQHYLIVYIKEGTGTLLSLKEKKKMNAGQLFVMFPGEETHYEVDKNSLWSISWVGIYGNMLNGLFERLGITPANPLLKLSQPVAVEDIFEEIYRLSFIDTVSGKLSVIGLLYKFFSLILSEENTKSEQDRVKAALNIIDYNYDKNISVEEIAKSLYINPSYLSRLFRERMGVSLKEYITDKKIERAKKLLSMASISVSVAANSVGISDTLYFSRLFRKKTGMCPTEYRKNHNKTFP